MAQDNEDVVGGGVAQWRVVGVLNGEEVENLLFARFADARVWAGATLVDAIDDDIPEDVDGVWNVLTRVEMEEAFANGEWSVVVASFKDHHEQGDVRRAIVRIERLVVA
jgi:hypothetical protein